jgi:hypothetical protein
MKSNYDKNVFINCPFDKDYQVLFNAILFAVHKCGFILRCSKEYDDTSKIRIQNIVKLIRECKYSIHDLSRVSLDEHNKLPRFNMPLELGIVIGSMEFGSKTHKQKEYLIIESDQFRFKQFISDLSGQDIREHKNDPKKIIRVVRDWLSKRTEETIPSGSIIFDEFQEFNSKLPELCQASNWLIDELTFLEYTSLVVSWLASDNSVD